MQPVAALGAHRDVERPPGASLRGKGWVGREGNELREGRAVQQPLLLLLLGALEGPMYPVVPSPLFVSGGSDSASVAQPPGDRRPSSILLVDGSLAPSPIGHFAASSSLLSAPSC